MATRLPAGSLVITTDRDGSPRFEAKWREHGKQYKRRIPGKAWLEPDGHGGWKRKRGRPPEGHLDRTDASIALRAMIAAHAAENGSQTAGDIPTFAQAAERWYQRAVKRQRKPATLLSYRQVIDVHIAGAPTKAIPVVCPFASKPISDVSKRDMIGWFDRLPHSRTKERLFKFVKSICTMAVSEDWAAVNVALAVECPTMPTDSYLDIYTTAEIKRLIEAARDEYDSAAFAVAAFAGLRRGELLALTWADIDLKRSRISVRRNISGDTLTTPKSGRLRTVPIVPELAARLKKLKISQPRKGIEQRFVFASPKRKHRGHAWADAKALERRYKAALLRAKLRPLPLHSLRHYFGSQAVNVATLVQVQSWLGHADLRTTARYLHARNLDSDSALLAEAF